MIYVIIAVVLAVYLTILATTKAIHYKIAVGELFLINGVVYKGAILLKNPATSVVTAAQTVVLPPKEPSDKEIW